MVSSSMRIEDPVAKKLHCRNLVPYTTGVNPQVWCIVQFSEPFPINFSFPTKGFDATRLLGFLPKVSE